MKVLIVCSKNSGKIAPFISDQVVAIQKFGIDIDFFTIEQKGVLGYLKSRKGLIRKIKEFNPTIIHAHFGLSGLLANLQRKIPVVTTFHGCDINKFNLRFISSYPLILSRFNIFVSQNQADKVPLLRKKYAVIPCGIDPSVFYPLPKDEQKKVLGWNLTKKKILFSSDFSRPEKNANLALEALKLMPDSEIIELKGYAREELRRLMNACDVGLLTSIREGSPMFVKEMMACGKPLVCTDVGDIRVQIEGVDGCEIVDFNPVKVKEALERVMKFEKVNYPSERLDANNNDNIAQRIHQIYTSILK